MKKLTISATHAQVEAAEYLLSQWIESETAQRRPNLLYICLLSSATEALVMMRKKLVVHQVKYSFKFPMAMGSAVIYALGHFTSSNDAWHLQTANHFVNTLHPQLS